MRKGSSNRHVASIRHGDGALDSSPGTRRRYPSTRAAGGSDAGRRIVDGDPMDLLAWVAERGGVVRAAEARKAGFSKRSLASAIAEGTLTRPRGGWVAVRGADPYLVAAARAGVVVTCVTRAARLDLWIPEESGPEERPRSHVAAPAHSSRVSAVNAVVHWAVPWIQRVPGTLEDPIENTLQLVASCQPFESALVIWESALRKDLVTREVLLRMPLAGAARTLAEVATPFSDSGLETYVLVRLRWLRLPILPQAWIAGRPVDFLIGDRLVLQIDGGHHVGRQREADIAHDALLLTMGYHVIRVGYAQVIERWHAVQDDLMRAIAQGLHLA
jgi:very-short-patch-repair endonuclease